MNVSEWIGERFDEHRTHLRAIARQMLGPSEQADAAVRAAREQVMQSEDRGSESIRRWFTMTLAVVCIDILRRRTFSGAEPAVSEPAICTRAHVPDISLAGESELCHETLLADSVSLALFVLLESLTPGERMAFVLDNVFGLSVGEIARMVGGSPASVKELTKRARCRVQGDAPADQAW
jgi:RNA polymerase sigma factor (sigma-70 family)